MEAKKDAKQVEEEERGGGVADVDCLGDGGGFSLNHDKIAEGDLRTCWLRNGW